MLANKPNIEYNSEKNIVNVKFDYPIVIHNNFEIILVTKEIKHTVKDHVMFFGYNFEDLQYSYFYENTPFPILLYGIKIEKYNGMENV